MTRDMEATRQTLEKAGYEVKIRRNRLILYELNAIEAPDEVANILFQAGVPLTRLAVEQEMLEDYFLRLTGAQG
jgi:hypothetical protein